MDNKNLAQELSRYICAEVAGNPPEQPIAPDFPLIEGGLVDSLGLFKVIAFMEDNLDVSVDPEEIQFDNFATINAIVALVESKRSGGGAA